MLKMVAGALTAMVIGTRAMSSRSGMGRRDAYRSEAIVVAYVGGADVHTVRDIDPSEP